MNGFVVNLCYINDDNTEKYTFKRVHGQSIFNTFFKDVLYDLGGLYWYSPESPFTSQYALNESEINYFFSDLLEEFERNDVCMPYSLFPKYARWIRDDNTNLYGFKNEPCIDIINSKLDAEFISRNVDIYLENQDAIFWGCYSSDNIILEKCLNSVCRIVDKKHIGLLEFTDSGY